ncbi:MAG TPA: ABC transporter permease [Bryobacteraceae bacterium]|nr:ABC transporter permease [Bryobacteraceae bacterium]
MSLWSRFANVFRQDRVTREIDEELEAHISEAVENGEDPAEARRALGSALQHRESSHDVRVIPWLDALRRDCRHAFRLMRRDAAFTTFALLIVGLGIAANSTVFSVFNTLLLRPLPFSSPQDLVWIANGTSENLSSQTTQVSYLLALEAESRALADVAAYSPFYGAGDVRLTGRGEAERLTAVPVTEGFFRLLGIQPAAGRFFTQEECQQNGPKSVVLSHTFWARRLQGDRSILGRALILDGAPATVVGVLPASFDFGATFTPGNRADVFVPFPLSSEKDRQGNTLALIGRLSPGATVASAATEASVIADRLRRERSAGQRRNEFRPRIQTLRERISGRHEYALTVLLGAVGFLMLLVCANLSNLLLVRASARQKEMAIRAAIGAGRGALIRQMLIESGTLALSGALLGLLLAWFCTSMLAQWEDTAIPLLRDVQLDGWAVAYTVLVTAMTGLLFGLAPALQLAKAAPNDSLKEGARDSSHGGRRGAWTRRALVAAEVALVCVLLTGSGLLVRSFFRVLEVHPGFSSENVVALRIDPAKDYKTLEQKNAYFDDILRAVRAVPGVESAGLTDALPLGDNFGWRTWDAAAKGAVGTGGEGLSPLVRMIDETYLQAMRIPLLAGRAFTPADTAQSEDVILINTDLARRLWPGEDPLGKVLRTSGKDRRVVGVVEPVRYFALEKGTRPEMYMPIRQTGDYQVVDMVVRSAKPPASIVPSVRAALTNADPALPVSNFRTMQQLVDHSLFPRRSMALLLTGFAAFGLVLATLGIYSVISYSVTHRKQEIGIRMALGASPGDLRAAVLAETGQLALVGVCIGVPASLIVARALRSLLFEVTFLDPYTFVGVLVLLAAVAGAAGYLPARSASRLNPLDALRAQ